MKRLTLLISLTALIFSGCMDIPDDIAMPQYDSKFNFPLTNQSYLLSEQIDVEKDEFLSADELNQYVYKIEYDTLADERDIIDFIDSRLDAEYLDIDIPALNATGSLFIAFSDSIALDQAAITQGQFKLIVRNNGDVEVSFDITLPAFKKFLNAGSWLPGGSEAPQLGDPIKINSTLAPGEETTLTQDITDYYYDASAQEDKGKLKVVGTMASEGEGGVEADIIIENSSFRYISGKLPSLSLNPITAAFSLPIGDDVRDFRGKFVLHDPTLVIKAKYVSEVLANSGGTINEIFDIMIEEMVVVGHTDDGEAMNLTDQNGETNLGGIMISGGDMLEEFNNDNSNIAEFLSFLPDNIVVTALAIMNPETKQGSATNRDKIQIRFNLDINGILSISELKVNDEMEIEFDDDDRDIIRDGREALLTLELDNGLPLDGDLAIEFRGLNEFDADTLFFTKDVSFDGAEPDENYFAQAPKNSKSEIHLDSLEIQQLAEAKSIVLDMTFSTTGGKTVAVRSTDSIHIVSYGWVVYHINLDDDE